MSETASSAERKSTIARDMAYVTLGALAVFGVLSVFGTAHLGHRLFAGDVK